MGSSCAKITFYFSDGTENSQTITFPSSNGNNIRLTRHDFTVSDDTKKVVKIVINNCGNNNLKIYKIEHRIS